MADSVKCACPHCGAKYRLPVETAGRSVRCKQCDTKFKVPQADRTMDDTVMSWLADETSPEEPTTTLPRVIQMPPEQQANGDSSSQSPKLTAKGGRH